MLKAIIILTSFVVLAACSGGESLTACKGPVFQLNAGHWTPTPVDLKKPEPVVAKLAPAAPASTKSNPSVASDG